jgi:DNA-binding transcriptional LysR family regulator
MRNVTLKQIRAFVAVAAEKSFTRAASKLNLSQSALTLQVRELEQEVGLKLLHRSTRSVELTSAGQEFLPLSARLLDDLSHALDDLHALARGARGSVVVIAGASVISLVVAPSIAELGKCFPGITIRILEDLGDEVTRRVVAGEADFGIGSFVRPSREVDSSLLLRDRIGILCVRGHALAGKRILRANDLTQHPLAILGQGTVLQTLLVRNPDVNAVLPRPNYEASSVSALVSLVEQGAAIALLPSLAAYPVLGRKLVFRPIHEPAMFRDLFFIAPRRRSLTPAAQQVASAIVERFEAVGRIRGIDLTMSAADLAAVRRKIEAAARILQPGP